MTERELALLFPQWQGNGLSTKLSDGARAIAHLLPSTLSTETVPVTSLQPLAVERNILGLTPLLQQLDTAHHLLRTYQPSRLLTIGGDCAVDIAPISYLADQYGDSLTVLWFDAHADLNTPATSPSGHLHGMPLRILLGEGDAAFVQRCFTSMHPRRVLLIGSRDFDSAETDYLATHSVPVIYPCSDSSTVIPQIDSELHQRQTAHLHIHLDLDVFDPSEFPYVTYRVPQGPSIATVVEVLSHLSTQYTVVGMSVTEYVSEANQGLEAIKQCLAAGFGMAI